MTSLNFFIIISSLLINLGISKGEDVIDNKKCNIKVISVGYHSDNCDDCNLLKAKMKKMNRKFLTSPIVFIKYNHTNKKTKSRSEKKLKKWHMLTIAKKEKGLKHVVLYNAKTKEPIVTLYHSDSALILERKIKEALISVP